MYVYQNIWKSYSVKIYALRKQSCLILQYRCSHRHHKTIRWQEFKEWNHTDFHRKLKLEDRQFKISIRTEYKTKGESKSSNKWQTCSLNLFWQPTLQDRHEVVTKHSLERIKLIYKRFAANFTVISNLTCLNFNSYEYGEEKCGDTLKTYARKDLICFKEWYYSPRQAWGGNQAFIGENQTYI
jgi:hypothetical protein